VLLRGCDIDILLLRGAMRKRGASWHLSFVTLMYCIQLAVRYLENFYLRGSPIII